MLRALDVQDIRVFDPASAHRKALAAKTSVTAALESFAEGHRGRLASIRCRARENFPKARPDYRTLYYAKYGGAFDLVYEVDKTTNEKA